MFKTIRRDLANLGIKYIDNNYIFAPPVLLLLIEVILFYFWGFRVALLGAVPLMLFVVLALAFHLYRKTASDLEEERRQNQALISIHHFLDLRAPLPSMTRWAAYPELGNVIIEYTRLLKPRFVLEAGSGVSTLIAAYALEKYGEGQLLSLDHDETYAAQTNGLLKKHELAETARVVFSPLKRYDLNGKSWEWYDLGPPGDFPLIDLLVIDGPPLETQPKARYPALPLLHERLSDRVVIILDDDARESEQEVVRQWLREYPDFILEFRSGRKGIAILQRNT